MYRGRFLPGMVETRDDINFPFWGAGCSFGPSFTFIKLYCMFYNGLLLLHSLLRWAIIILLLVAIVKSYTGMTAGKPFSAGDKKVGLFLMISAHTTLLVGLYLWFFFGPWGIANIGNLGFGAVMKDSVTCDIMRSSILRGMLMKTIIADLRSGGVSPRRGFLMRRSDKSGHSGSF